MKKYYVLSLLIWALPLVAEKRDVADSISECQLQHLYNNSYDRDIYFGKDVSNIVNVIRCISEIDENKNSCLCELRNYIDKGCLFGEWDAVAQALDYADLVLKKRHTWLPKKIAKKLTADLHLIINQMIDGSLCIDSNTIDFNNQCFI